MSSLSCESDDMINDAISIEEDVLNLTQKVRPFLKTWFKSESIFNDFLIPIYLATDPSIAGTGQPFVRRPDQ